MPVNQLSRQEMDAVARKAVVDVQVALDNVADLKAYIDSLPTDALTTEGAGFEYTTEEASDLANAIAALTQLRVVANAGGTVDQVDDFFFYAKKIRGYNPARR